MACRIRLSESEAMVQVTSSDASASSWVHFGKFTVPVSPQEGKVTWPCLPMRCRRGFSIGWCGRRSIKGSATKDKAKLMYQLRIDNASPLVLNGLAIVGTASKEDEMPKVLSMISVSPRKSLTVPTERATWSETWGSRRGSRSWRLISAGSDRRTPRPCGSPFSIRARLNNVQVQLSE